MSVSPATTEQVMANSLRKPTLRHLLEETDRFITAVELVTSRGLLSDQEGQRVLARAACSGREPRIDVLSITDNPAGNAMLAADTLGTDLMLAWPGSDHPPCLQGLQPEFARKAAGWNLASEGFDNILALSGDYPSPGYGGMARPSFDIDSVGLLSMYSEMNRGLFDEGTGRPMTPTNFFLGAVVTNHKRHEREVVPQYLKLRRKIDTGARFIINQVGYNARKDDELLRWLALSGLDVPVIANVFVLSLGAARAFNAGRIPGVVVTDELVALAERYASSADKGRSFFLELASKQVAIARGLGFRGAYLGGKLEPSDCEEILARAEEFGPDGWKEFAGDVQFDYPDEFYYFERDEATGLSSSKVNRAFVASRSSAARRRARLRAPVGYRTSRLAHSAVFDPEAPLFDLARRFYAAVERRPRPAQTVLHLAEHTVEEAAVRLPGLRRLLVGRDRLSLPRVSMCEEPAQRPLRRDARRPLRGRREGVHLGPRLRKAEALRRGGPRCWTDQSSSTTTPFVARAPGRTLSWDATT